MVTDNSEDYISFPCIRALLMLFNIAFWLSGLAIIWAGIWMQTDLQNYVKISTEYSNVAPYVLVTIGTIIIFVATLACTCIVKVQPSLLVIYGGFLIIVLFTVITLSAYIYTYKDQLISGFGDGIRHNIRYYNKPTTKNGKLIDFIQKNLHCCGVESYLDWARSPKKIVPESCCSNTTFGDCKSSDPKDLYKIGCLQSLIEFVNSNLATIGATASAIAFFPLFGTILAFCLASTAKKSEYELI